MSKLYVECERELTLFVKYNVECIYPCGCVNSNKSFFHSAQTKERLGRTWLDYKKYFLKKKSNVISENNR